MLAWGPVLVDGCVVLLHRSSLRARRGTRLDPAAGPFPGGPGALSVAAREPVDVGNRTGAWRFRAEPY